MGYDDKAESIYKVWDPLDDSILCVRNVIFNETLFYQGETLDDTPLTFNILEPSDQSQPATMSVPPLSDPASEPTPEPTPAPPETFPIADTIQEPLAIQARERTPTPGPQGPLLQPSHLPVVSNYSLRSRVRPEALLSALATSPIPNNYQDAVRSPDFPMWKGAIDMEFNALMGNNT